MLKHEGEDVMIDQHMHCIFSRGSDVLVNQYLTLAINEYNNEYINLTDHFDVYKNLPISDSIDFFENFDAMELSVKESNGKVMMGIEVGYNATCEEEISKFLNNYDFSIILLSIHDNDLKSYQYSMIKDCNLSEEEVINDYFSQMKEGVASSIEFDVLSHVGYIFRYLPTTVDPLKYIFMMEEVLKILITKDKALEINTSCLFDFNYDGETFYSNVLQLYKELGGYKISLGSDAHSLNKYCNHFEKAIKFIKDNNFNELTIIKKRIHTQVTI